MSNNHQQYDDLENKLLQKTEDKKKKKMKISGKSVFEIQKIISKNKNNSDINFNHEKKRP